MITSVLPLSRFLSIIACLGALPLLTGPRIGAQEQPAARPKAVQEGKGHSFVCTDYSAGKVFIVNPDGKVEWNTRLDIAMICGRCPTAIFCSTRVTV